MDENADASQAIFEPSTENWRRPPGRPRTTWMKNIRDDLGPDLQNILRQSYDRLTIMPKLPSTYDGRLIYKTSYKERKALLRYDSLAKL